MASTTNGKVKQPSRGGGGETFRFLLFLFLAAVIVRTFILAPFMIPSGSMLPRMMIGDYLFVAKWPYGFSRYAFPFGLARFEGRVFGRDPERGDIVIFRYPGRDEDYVKRLIGLPGDRVQMRGGRLYLNAKVVPKVRIADFLMPKSPNSACRVVADYHPAPVRQGDRILCPYPRYRETLPNGRSYEVLDQGTSEGDDTPVFVVPADHYFMMGDNRDDSADSRFSVANQGVGFLSRDNVIGRPLITFWSTDGSVSWIKPWTWFTAARWDRIGRPY
ncbi:MAG: signal peptidase [Sphingomonadales bacterium]|jgi:signal peptidase I|nr:signal peptidase [Sphingomonadales bacterium]